MVTSGNTTYAVEHEPNRIVIGERLRAELVRRVHELEHRADPSRTPRAFCLAGNTQGVTAMNDREPVPAVVIGLVAAAISGGIVGGLITAIVTLMAMSQF